MNCADCEISDEKTKLYFDVFADEKVCLDCLKIRRENRRINQREDDREDDRLFGKKEKLNEL